MASISHRLPTVASPSFFLPESILKMFILVFMDTTLSVLCKTRLYQTYSLASMGKAQIKGLKSFRKEQKVSS